MNKLVLDGYLAVLLSPELLHREEPKVIDIDRLIDDTEFAVALRDPDGASIEPASGRTWAAGHTHDDTVGSVGIRADGTVDPTVGVPAIVAIIAGATGFLFGAEVAKQAAKQAEKNILQQPPDPPPAP